MATVYHEVSTIYQYIQFVDEHNLRMTISRGEPKVFDRITASGYRRFGHDQKKTILSMLKMAYSEIGNGLTALQKEHFLAFCQHHGIPTNLIDFSTSPLISLYFACSDRISKYDGVVHFISRKKCVDITSFMNKLSYEQQLGILNNLFLYGPEIDGILSLIDDCCDEHYDTIYDGIREVFMSFPDWMRSDISIEKELLLYIQHTNDSNLAVSDLSKCITEIDYLLNDTDGKRFETKINSRGLTVFLLLFTFKKCFYDKSRPFPFYFIYNPPNICSRIRNQSSIFVYQQSKNTGEYQTIVPDYTVIIKDKSKIRQSLDMLGINEKFVFSDIDSIAHYIKEHVFIEMGLDYP